MFDHIFEFLQNDSARVVQTISTLRSFARFGQGLSVDGVLVAGSTQEVSSTGLHVAIVFFCSRVTLKKKTDASFNVVSRL